MEPSQPDRFARFPVALLEALIQARLSAIQARVIYWVIRHTFGWHKQWAPYTWYRISEDMGAARSAVYRAGRRLIQAGVLAEHQGQLAVQMHLAVWNRKLFEKSAADKHLWITSNSTNDQNHEALLPGNESVAWKQRFSDELKIVKIKTTS